MKKEHGVSPVIAEILLIAISMILVATLYLFVVGGYINTPYAVDQLRGYLVMNSQKSTSTKIIFDITLSSPQRTNLGNVKINIIHNSQIVHLTYKGNLIWSNATPGGKWHYEARLQDNDGDGKFSNGDTLIVYVVDNNPSDSITPPPFQNGDKVTFSITGYNGVSAGGVVEF